MGFLAQPGDLVMLGGEPGQGLAAESREFADRGVCLCETLLQPGDLVLGPGSMGVAGVRALSGIAGVVRGAVRTRCAGGVGRLPYKAVWSTLASRAGSDVVFPAGRDVAVQEPAPWRPDLASLSASSLPAESIQVLLALRSARIRARTRTARSYSASRRFLSLPCRPSERALLVCSACSAQTGRWRGWCVAWGSGGVAHADEGPAGGRVPRAEAEGAGGVGEPGSSWRCRGAGRGALERLRISGRCAGSGRGGLGGISLASMSAKRSVSSRAPGPAGMMPCR